MADNSGVQLIEPHDAAAMIGIGVHSIRRWCDWHKEHLSAMANPGSGASRRLTLRDIEVLRAVKTLRAQGLQTKIINERLKSMAFPDVDTEEEPAQKSTDLQPAQQPQQAALQSFDAPVLVDTLKSIQTRLEAVEQAQQAADAQRPTWRDVFIIALASLAIGLMIGLSVWWFQ